MFNFLSVVFQYVKKLTRWIPHLSTLNAPLWNEKKHICKSWQELATFLGFRIYKSEVPTGLYKRPAAGGYMRAYL